MAKSGKAVDRLKMMSESLRHFNALIDGHRKLLAAIGEL